MHFFFRKIILKEGRGVFFIFRKIFPVTTTLFYLENSQTACPPRLTKFMTNLSLTRMSF